MDIRILRYFLAVAREENITRAAESLHIAQPSLSKQMMELEQELGNQLLIRGKRKVTLTEEGMLLRKRAEDIVSLVEKNGTGDFLRFYRHLRRNCHRRYCGGNTSPLSIFHANEVPGSNFSVLQRRCHRYYGTSGPWKHGLCYPASAY